MAVADVNGDGKPDLLVANKNVSAVNYTGAVGVLLGNGDGTFQPAVTYTSAGYGASSVTAADVNGDGKLDLLVGNECIDMQCGALGGSSDGSVSVLLGNGDGTFQPAVAYDAAYGFTSAVAAADLNGDGKLDLIVSNACPDLMGTCAPGNTGYVGVLLGNGDGTFQPGVIYSSGGQTTSSLAVADVNGDGKPDILVVSSCEQPADCKQVDAPVGVLLGNGDGTLQTVTTYDSGGQEATTMAIADLHGNGKLDAAVAFICIPGGQCNSGPQGGLSVSPGNGDGSFQKGMIIGSTRTATSKL